LIRTITHHRTADIAFLAMRGMGVRAIWSRVTSIRADVKLAPSMARPNLFSGD
jgi:hypothetical protein